MSRCSFDSDGIPRVSAEGLYAVIATFFEDDVQSNIDCCDELLAALSDVQTGKVSEWSATGNANTVTIENGVVLLENEFSPAIRPVTLSFDEFRQWIVEWRALVSGPRKR